MHGVREAGNMSGGFAATNATGTVAPPSHLFEVSVATAPAQPPQPDLTACDREPIHVPGRVQPHGVLLVADAAGLRVLHASDNCARHLRANAAGLIGGPLDAALSPDAAALLRAKLGAIPTDD